MNRQDKDQIILSMNINQVVVGSLNPVKLNSVKEALRLIYHSLSLKIKGVNVESCV